MDPDPFVRGTDTAHPHENVTDPQSLKKSRTITSVLDPLRFGSDPNQRIRTIDYGSGLVSGSYKSLL